MGHVVRENTALMGGLNLILTSRIKATTNHTFTSGKMGNDNIQAVMFHPLNFQNSEDLNDKFK